MSELAAAPETGTTASVAPSSRPTLLRNLRWLVGYQGSRWVIGFLMGAWMARALGPRDYGVLAAASAAAAIAWCGVELGMKQILLVELSRRRRIAGLVAGTAAKLWMQSGLFFALLAACWNGFSDGAPRVPWWVFWATMTPLLLMFCQIHNFWEEASHRAFVAARNRMAGYLSAAFVRLGCLLGWPTVTALAWTNASEHVVSGALGAVFGKRRGRSVWLRGWNSRIARSLLSRGALVMVGQVGMLSLLRADTIMLEDMRGKMDTGIYSAAVRLSEMAHLIAPMIITVLLPKLAAMAKGSRAELVALEAQGAGLMTSVGLAATLGLGVAGPLALRWLFGPEYAAAEQVLLVHALSVVPLFMMEWRGALLVALDKAKLSAAVAWAAALLNIVLNVLWIPSHGPMGAAWATVVSYTLGGFFATWLLPDCRWLAVSQVKSLLAPLRWMLSPRIEWARWSSR